LLTNRLNPAKIEPGEDIELQRYDLISLPKIEGFKQAIAENAYTEYETKRKTGNLKRKSETSADEPRKKKLKGK
jgi:hypothetical protein